MQFRQIAVKYYFLIMLKAVTPKLKINSNVVFFRPVLFFSTSSVLEKAFKKPAKDKENALNIKDKVDVPVEKDPNKLANFVCGTNLFVEGGEDVKLKPDSEYPEWLWSIHPPLPLEQLDKNSKEYWIEVQKIREREEAYLQSLERITTVHK